MLSVYINIFFPIYNWDTSNPYVPSARDAEILSNCAAISTPAGPPPSYNPSRRLAKGSDRYVAGTPPVLIQNARVWTGAENGTQTFQGDVLLDKGLIFALGSVPTRVLRRVEAEKGFQIVDAGGRWVTPGLVDLHSHMGVDSAPHLDGQWKIRPLLAMNLTS
jgi:hypothetical protein